MNFIIYCPHLISLRRRNKEEMGRVYGSYREENKFIHGLVGKPEKRDNFDDIDVGERIILKGILRGGVE
jgi:hypothetical protein